MIQELYFYLDVDGDQTIIYSKKIFQALNDFKAFSFPGANK